MAILWRFFALADMPRTTLFPITSNPIAKAGGAPMEQFELIGRHARDGTDRSPVHNPTFPETNE